MAFIFNQRFFQELRQETGLFLKVDTHLESAFRDSRCDVHLCLPVLGIDLENIVYYKDDTHYFVMTAKKQSLLEKGVILQVTHTHTPGVILYPSLRP